MLSMKDVNVTFNKNTELEKKALRDVSLEIKEGEFVTIIGSNGSGKSTLLNMIAGEIPVDSGMITLAGENITTYDALERAYSIARVFQDPAVGTCGALSVEENFALAYKRGQTRGLSAALTKARREAFIENLVALNIGLEHKIKSPMNTLSGGQRQVISLLMATLKPCKLLLLDEHTAALDPAMVETVIALTSRLAVEKSLTVLMITHVMQHAQELGSRILRMKDGHIAQVKSAYDQFDTRSSDENVLPYKKR